MAYLFQLNSISPSHPASENLSLSRYPLGLLFPGRTRVWFFARKLRFILIFGLLILLVQVLPSKKAFCCGSTPEDQLIWRYGQKDSGGSNIMLRFVNIIGSSYLFVAITDPNRLAYSLMQVGLPYRFGFMLITALRFIPVFQLELEQVKNAQMAKVLNWKDYPQASY